MDASVSYLLNNWDFTLGSDNLTNVYPEGNSAANSYHGILPYPNSSPFGFSGAYYYVRVALLDGKLVLTVFQSPGYGQWAT